MLKDINNLKQILSEEKHTIVIQSEKGEIFTSDERGIKPLIHILDENPSFLKNAMIADKVIGKAAAMLMVLGDIKEVFTFVISKPALHTLVKNNVIVSYETLTEGIINRRGDGLCPMESLCLDIDNPETAYMMLKEKIKSY